MASLLPDVDIRPLCIELYFPQQTCPAVTHMITVTEAASAVTDHCTSVTVRVICCHRLEQITAETEDLIMIYCHLP